MRSITHFATYVAAQANFPDVWLPARGDARDQVTFHLPPRRESAWPCCRLSAAARGWDSQIPGFGVLPTGVAMIVMEYLGAVEERRMAASLARRDLRQAIDSDPTVHSYELLAAMKSVYLREKTAEAAGERCETFWEATERSDDWKPIVTWHLERGFAPNAQQFLSEARDPTRRIAHLANDCLRELEARLGRCGLEMEAHCRTNLEVLQEQISVGRFNTAMTYLPSYARQVKVEVLKLVLFTFLQPPDPHGAAS